MMDLQDFKINEVFWTGAGKWVCSDIGTRTILAVKYEEMIEQYGNIVDDPVCCIEHPFHRYDWGGCWATEEEYNELIAQG